MTATREQAALINVTLRNARATEKVAEQLRIANLITLIGFTEELGDEYAVPDRELYERIAKELELK